MPTVRPITPTRARRILVRAARLETNGQGRGLRGARRCLDQLGEIQLDPIDRIGANADLVLHARVDGIRRGDAGRLDDCFEHFAKERCLLPARRFSAWRQRVAEAPWWRLEVRCPPRRALRAMLDRLGRMQVKRPTAPTARRG